MNRDMSPDTRCRLRAARQHNVLTYPQAQALAMSLASIERRLKAGKWRKVYRSVLTPFPVNVDWYGLQLAACLHAGGHSVAAGSAAARLRRLPTFDASPVEILTNNDPRCPGILVNRTRKLLERPRISASGIPIEPCESMLVRIAARHSVEIAGSTFDECWRRNMSDPRRLIRFLDGGGQGMRGAKAMRCVVKERLEWSEVTDSELETLFLTLARRYRLIPDQSHIVIYDGKVRVKEVDFVYSGARLAIELDSYKFHGALDPFDADREVDAVLQRLGWRIIRVTWRHLKQNPDRVFNEIRLALGVVPLPNLSR